MKLIFFQVFLGLTLSSHCLAADIFNNNAIYNEATIYDFIGDDPFFEVVYPESLKFTYRLRQARNFGTNFPFPQRGVRLVVADPLSGCSPLYNQMEVFGAVVLVTRGSCSFVSKAINAEEAGAVAVIVTEKDTMNDIYIQMVADETGREPSIPAFFLLGKNGDVIRQTLLTNHINEAIINIPVNLTNVAIDKLNQPPWIRW